MKKKIYYKGFDKNLRCRGFQYEIGKSYTHKGEIKPCKSGFHACEYPLSVFNYYAPADSRFAEVKASGIIVPADDKIACEKLKIKAELSFDALIKAAINFTFDRAKGCKEKSTTGDRGAASATGDQGIACALGYKCKAKGAKGCWLVLAERDDNGKILNVKTFCVDGKNIKENIFYILENGKLTEAINE